MKKKDLYIYYFVFLFCFYKTKTLDPRTPALSIHFLTACFLKKSGLLTFLASGLDINGCVLSYFEGTSNLQAVHSLLYIVAKYHFFSVVT